MKCKIHITGASGFIGGQLYKYLKNKKYEVVGYSRNYHKKLTKILSYNELEGNNKDILVHLAQFSNTKKTIKKKDIENNLNTSKYLSELKWKHIIYISSTNVYGSGYKQKKENEKITPNKLKKNNDIYSFIKAKSENIFLKKNASILRLSNVYGKNMSKDSLFINIIDQLSKNKIIINDSRPIRDYIHINDVLKSINFFINKKKTGIFNISYGTSYSVKYIVLLIFKILNIENKKLVSKNKYKKNHVYVDNMKLYRAFKWKPNISLKEGLKNILNDKK